MAKLKKEFSAYEEAAKKDLETAADFIQITAINVARHYQSPTDYKAVRPTAIKKEMVNLRKAIRYLNNVLKGINPED